MAPPKWKRLPIYPPSGLDKTAELFPKAAETALLIMKLYPADRAKQIAVARTLQDHARSAGNGAALMACRMAVELLVGGWVPL